MNLSQKRLLIADGPCEVRFDGLARHLYATDASIYQIEPFGVALPRNAEEASWVIQAADEAGVSVTPRGAGTGLAGGAIGDGLVIDFSRYCRQISEFDPERQMVRVGPGVVLDQLNAFLLPYGYWFGPDVATGSRATLGGMIANNSSGARAPIYGTTADHVISLEIVLDDGRIETIGEGHHALADLRHSIDTAVAPHADLILERFPEVLVKHWPGYGIDRFVRNGRDLTALLSGSEGTLAAVTSAEIRVVPLPKEKGCGLFFFASVAEALQATVEFLDLEPAAIEHIDRVLFDQTRGQLAFKAARDLLRLDDQPCESILIVEFYDDVDERLSELVRRRTGLRSLILSDPDEMELVWELRKAGLSLLTGRKGPAKPIAGIEDVAVRPHQLPEYVAGLKDVMDRLGLEGSFYGHAGAGLLHVRPVLDLHKQDDIEKYRRLSEEVSALTLEFKGSFAAEHGVGIARTEFMPDHLGPELMHVTREVKRLFDPRGLFNPGKVLPEDGGGRPAPRFRIDSHLRQGARHQIELPFDPVLAFAARDGSLVANLEQCNGCGGCRKEEPTMCPTFLATGEEVMSTRGRANTVRAALELRLQGNGNPLDSKELNEALSNCLSCKACTTECPSNVNMALIKAELMHARHRIAGLTLRERMVSSVDRLGRLGCIMPRLANFIMRRRVVRKKLHKWVGFTKKRPFPPFATRRFDKWFKRHKRHKRIVPATRGRVILWDDTFVRFFEPNVGRAAVAVLEAAGFEVVLEKKRKCCGRPAFSAGRLDKANALAKYNVRLFRQRGGDEPIIFLEPSCYSMVAEDYRELGVEGADEVARRCIQFEDFIADLLDEEPGALRFKPSFSWVAIHAHCHTKSLGDPHVGERLARCLPNSEVTYLDTGCCGMAGQFGQLREKYDLSLQIAKPLVRQIGALRAGTEVVASGTSCRHQIDHLTDVKPIHMAELLAEALDND